MVEENFEIDLMKHSRMKKFLKLACWNTLEWLKFCNSEIYLPWLKKMSKLIFWDIVEWLNFYNSEIIYSPWVYYHGWITFLKFRLGNYALQNSISWLFLTSYPKKYTILPDRIKKKFEIWIFKCKTVQNDSCIVHVFFISNHFFWLSLELLSVTCNFSLKVAKWLLIIPFLIP